MSQEEVNRKLSCILSTDVVGYSRLMEENEASTVRYLEENKKLITKLIEEHNGRVIDSPGDNLLAEFSSAVKAVDCAVKIQKELKIRNAELVENRRMQFRIGINLGDVIEEEGRLYGNGVNIAARLESLADPGGICISRNVYDQVKTKLDLGYEYLGEQDVKNISEPVRVYRVQTGIVATGKDVNKKIHGGIFFKRNIIIVLIIIIAGFLVWRFYPSKPENQTPETIAVLPFDDISPEKDQEYFVDGLSEEILNSLTQIPNLRVIAKTSSFSFKGQNKTVQEIAKVLRVDHVLEGSVRKSGNTIRITAQLIKADDESHIWSEEYDKDLGVKELFAVQEDIANNVADKLKLTLEAFQMGGTDNLEAYELYLIAKAQVLPNAIIARQALESIETAIDLDPGFALAWATKSTLHNILVTFGPSNNVFMEQEMALNTAMKAIEIEPKLAAAYNALGAAKFARGEWIGAELAYRKASELSTSRLIDPSNGYFTTCVGHFKRTIKYLAVNNKYDPLNENSRFWYIISLGLLGNNERFSEENEIVKKLLKDPWKPDDNNKIIYFMCIWLLRLGVDESISSDEIVWSHTISDVVKNYLKSPEEGLKELRRIYTDSENLSSSDNFFISLWAAYFGDSDFAMDAMEKGFRIHAGGLFSVWYPAMHDLRKTSRFKEFVREIGLVDYWKEYGWPDKDLCHPVGDDDFECE